MPEKASVLQFLRDLWTSGWRWIHWNVEYSLRSRIGASIERFNGSSVNQRFKNVPKITQQTKITPLNKSRYPPQMIFEETFSAIQTDIKDFEFEIPNDGLSRIAETRISDLKQKQHKKWNLDFSDKNRSLKMRQSRCLFLLAIIRFWYAKNCSANSFSWLFDAHDFRILFIQNESKKNARKSICTAIFERFVNLWLTLDPLKRWILAPITDRSEYWTFQWIQRQPEVQKCPKNYPTDQNNSAQ